MLIQQIKQHNHLYYHYHKYHMNLKQNFLEKLQHNHNHLLMVYYHLQNLHHKPRNYLLHLNHHMIQHNLYQDHQHLFQLKQYHSFLHNLQLNHCYNHNLYYMYYCLQQYQHHKQYQEIVLRKYFQLFHLQELHQI